MLETRLDSRRSELGEQVVARVAQDVPLEGGKMIPAFSRVLGKITKVDDTGRAGNLSVRFDRIELSGRQIKISTQFRAVAGVLEISGAQSPSSAFVGSPKDWTTVQIGGDTVYGADKRVVADTGETVGKPVPGGVLDTVVENCDGVTPVNNQPQALWRFSSDACGVYGIRHLRVANETASSGDREIVFSGEKHVNLRSGTGMLLMMTD